VKLQAVQVRLMGDVDSVTAVAKHLASIGAIVTTGSAPNRGDGGLRVYGVAIAPIADVPVPAKRKRA
jgi:hypothetical protein